MPTFDDHTRSDAPPEQVWKLLYDPARFPDWWAGIGTTEPDPPDRPAHSPPQTGYTMYPAGYPDFPMPQALQTRHDTHSVTISCLVSDLSFQWRLEPLRGGAATSIAVHVDIPDAEAHRLTTQRDLIHRSLRNLAELATTTG